jgi:D-amino-acid oxidase
MSKKIVVIGAGVIGITTAITLLEQNYKVTVISKDKPFATNSDIAVASWHPSSNKRPLLQRLCIESLPVFDELSKVAGSGVSWISVVKYMKTYDSYKENPWMKLVKSKAEFSPSIVTSEVYPYRLMLRVPLADVNFYRPFLFRLFEKLGGKLEQVKIESFTDLTGSYDAIINCSGWETKYLQRDARVHPIRGQTTILEVPADYKTPISFGNGHLNAYAIFRPESHDCVIGTTYKVNDCKTAISQKEMEEIFAKVSAFIPDIRQFKVKQDKVGLRCGRQDVHIKSEWLSDTLLVHCYGHNSSGFSASWASAKEVLKLCEAAFTTVL